MNEMAAIADIARTRRDGDELLTSGQVAWLLKIDETTVKLWGAIGVLKNESGANVNGRFRRAKVLTFLPAFSSRRVISSARKVRRPAIGGRRHVALSLAPALESLAVS